MADMWRVLYLEGPAEVAMLRRKGVPLPCSRLYLSNSCLGLVGD